MGDVGGGFSAVLVGIRAVLAGIRAVLAGIRADLAGIRAVLADIRVDLAGIRVDLAAACAHIFLRARASSMATCALYVLLNSALYNMGCE